MDIKTSPSRWSSVQVEVSGEKLLPYSHLASEMSLGQNVATRFLVLAKTKEPVVEEHVREVEPGNLKRTLAGVERGSRAISAGNFYPAPATSDSAIRLLACPRSLFTCPTDCGPHGSLWHSYGTTRGDCSGLLTLSFSGRFPSSLRGERASSPRQARPDQRRQQVCRHASPNTTPRHFQACHAAPTD